MTFGHRPSLLAVGRPVLVEPSASSANGSAGKPPPSFKAALLLVALVAGSSAFSIYSERTVSAAGDTAPGRVVDDGPYLARADCPRRAWTAGEYLPRACFLDNVLWAGARPELGLATPGRHRRDLFRYRWVRAGDDALLVRLPPGPFGRIDRVVRGRFAASAEDAATASVADAKRYDRPSLGYVATATFAHGKYAVLLLLVLPAYWALRRWAPRWPAKKPPQKPDWLNRAESEIAELQQAPPRG